MQIDCLLIWFLITLFIFSFSFCHNQSDQLFKIFQRRGTPTADVWPAVMRLPHYNTEFPQWREHPVTDFCPLETLGGLPGADLLTKLLQYDPDRRIACKTALQHPFFMQE
jgi:serine/threonine protein kinase